MISIDLRAGSLRWLRLYLQQPVRLSVVIITRPILVDIVKQVHPVMRYQALTVDDAIAALKFTELFFIFRNALVFLYINPLKT